ncbi:feronia receptor-like kinase, partial [Trifolium medium]|nr:feronia receptor-like kinase [Trifolium medium]
MVRLHFCEVDCRIKILGDRVFQIFIDDTLAEENADVIGWAGAPLIPVHKDYAVSMYIQEGDSEIERVNLSIKLHRLPKSMFTVYRDVTLNGIEIFKISDTNYNLAGSNPKSIVLSPKQQILPSQKSKKSTLVIIVVVGVKVLNKGPIPRKRPRQK